MYFHLNKTFILLFLIPFLFLSCTAKNIDLLGKDSVYNQGSEYTKLKTIIKDNDVKGILNITYLNPSYPKKFDNDYNEFLVGIYLDEFTNNYNMYLNKVKYISKKLVDKNTKLYKNIPVFNPHAKYYIFKFKKDKEKEALLEFEHKIYGTYNSIFKTF